MSQGIRFHHAILIDTNPLGLTKTNRLFNHKMSNKGSNEPHLNTTRKDKEMLIYPKAIIKTFIHLILQIKDLHSNK